MGWHGEEPCLSSGARCCPFAQTSSNPSLRSRSFLSEGKKTSILKTSILRKLLEHLAAKRCTKLLERAQRWAASSNFEQIHATCFCSSSFLRILVFKMLVFFLLDWCVPTKKNTTFKNEQTWKPSSKFMELESESCCLLFAQARLGLLIAPLQHDKPTRICSTKIGKEVKT